MNMGTPYYNIRIFIHSIFLNEIPTDRYGTLDTWILLALDRNFTINVLTTKLDESRIKLVTTAYIQTNAYYNKHSN